MFFFLYISKYNGNKQRNSKIKLNKLDTLCFKQHENVFIKSKVTLKLKKKMLRNTVVNFLLELHYYF